MNMTLLNRQTLKNYFKKGSFPTEMHFSHMIDSMINIVDDGIGRGVEDGFRISPLGFSKRLISFFGSYKDRLPSWHISLNENDIDGLSFQEGDQGVRLSLRKGGNVGINTLTPMHTLEVKGTCGFETRTGTFKKGKVPGDGKWHNIISGLDKIQAFEVMAQVSGRPLSGKYAIAHAIALTTFGGRMSKWKVRNTSAYYGSFFNRLQFRWDGTLHEYALQVRTRRHYGLDDRNGEPYLIQYNITRLWNPEEND
jgi:hypothetical protein